MKRIAIFLLIITFCPYALWAGNGEIIFWDAIDSRSSIFRINPDGTELKEIIKDGSYPRWSPDKNMISYISSSEDVGIADFEGKEIFKVEGGKGTLGGKLKKAMIWNHVWSPDSRKIAFISMLLNYVIVQVYDFDKQKIIVSLNKELQKTEWLFSSTIQFSPDSKKLIFSMEGIGNKGGIELVDISTKEKKLLSSEGMFARYWKDRILFATLDKKGTTFWTFNEEGTQKEKIFDSGLILTPVSEINRDRIFLQSGLDKGMPQLFLLNLNDGKFIDVNLKDFNLFLPEFSIEGEKILGVGFPSWKETGAGYFIIDLKSKNTVLLKKFSAERGRDYWWGLYLGSRRDYSWR